MDERVYNVLFLCTGNSARSIMAEALLTRLGKGQFRAYSAGSQPKGGINPLALRMIADEGLSNEGLYSKSWDQFAKPGAPEMDFVFTVCDNAAGEACPIWPGQPIMAHWGIEDPAAVEGTPLEKERAFVLAFKYLKNRIDVFVSLPIRSLHALNIHKQVREIGHQPGASLGRPDVARGAR